MFTATSSSALTDFMIKMLNNKHNPTNHHLYEECLIITITLKSKIFSTSNYNQNFFSVKKYQTFFGENFLYKSFDFLYKNFIILNKLFIIIYTPSWKKSTINISIQVNLTERSLFHRKRKILWKIQQML